MSDNYKTDIIPAEPEAPRPPVKWLRNLFYVHIVSIALSLVSLLPINDSFSVWISRAMTAIVVVCLFQLAPASDRYKKAAVFSAVSLGLNLAATLLLTTPLTLAASILSILATYQEYSGHSDMVAQADPKLSRQWHSLFNWQIAVGVLTSLVSMVAVVTLAALEMNATAITALIVGALSLVGVVLSVLYLVYLNRMIKIFSE